MKLLSIVVPVYNTQAYLERCLDSVLLADCNERLEVIAVNDGSTDGSAELLRRYAAQYPQTVVFIDKENGGHGSAVNAGLAAATGKYFRVLDSDDWLDTQNFTAFMQDLGHCSEDLIITPYTQEYTYNGVVYTYGYEFFAHDKVYQAALLKFDPSKMYYTMASSTYRTQLLRDCGMKLYEKAFYVDMQFNIFPIPYLKTVRFLKHTLYRYYMGRPNQSMSQENLLRHLPDHQRVLEFLVDYYAKMRDKCAENLRDYMGLMFYFMYYTHIDLVCQKMSDRHAAYVLIRDFDRSLKQKAPDLYERVSVFSYLRWSRRLGYRNVWLYNKLFTRVIALVRRRRGL